MISERGYGEPFVFGGSFRQPVQSHATIGGIVGGKGHISQVTHKFIFIFLKMSIYYSERLATGFRVYHLFVQQRNQHLFLQSAKLRVLVDPFGASLGIRSVLPRQANIEPQE
jgi:hypothetical protein